MSERKKSKKAEKSTMQPQEAIGKAQKRVAHWLRRNVPTKKTKFLHSHVVEYFVAARAVDALVEASPWSRAKAAEGSSPVFESRETAVAYLDELLKHKMFHRAKKIPVAEKTKKKKKGAEEKTDTEKDDDVKKGDDETAVAKAAKKDVAEKKKKRKIRLDMHLDQIFIDGQDAYVWLYDPIPWYYWLGGSAIVLGIIGVCLFPLWPPMMRKGVHYLSVAAAGFLIFIIGLGVIKYIIFGILFALSAGKLRFWIFPNLTEDVGFFESFVPLYDYTYIGGEKKKAKDSDDEEEDDEEEEEGGGGEVEAKKKDDEAAEQADHSESDDSSSKRSSTGKDFELVDKTDTDAPEEEVEEN